MRRFLLPALQWLHTGTVIGCMYLFFYTTFHHDVDAGAVCLFMLPFYLLVACIGLLSQWIKRFWILLPIYLAFSALCWLWSPIYAMAAAFVCISTLWSIYTKKQSWTVAPHFLYAVCFLLTYIQSVLFHNHSVQVVSCYGACFYLLLVFLYTNLGNMDRFIKNSLTVSNLPVRQIGRINGAILAVFLGFILLLFLTVAGIGAPGVSLHPQALLRKLILWLSEFGRGSYQMKQPSQSEIDMSQFAGPDTPRPAWLTGAYDVILYFLLAAGIILVLYGIYRVLRGIHWSARREEQNQQKGGRFTEEREWLAKEKIVRPRLLPDFSPNAIVRRRYKQSVLHHVQKPPAGWEAPREIEEAAGMDNAELHLLYEKARYSYGGCTREEAHRSRAGNRRLS